MKNNLKNYSHFTTSVIGAVSSSVGAFTDIDKLIAVGMIIFVVSLFGWIFSD